MTKPLVKKNFNTQLILLALIVSSWSNKSISIENHSPTIELHPYANYAEFARTSCLPCHYKGIPNGTDLETFFSSLSEAEKKAYLIPILKDGNMPPDKLYREVLYLKFLNIK